MQQLRSRYIALRDRLQLPSFPRHDEIAWLDVSLPSKPSSRQLAGLRDALLLTSAMSYPSFMNDIWLDSLCGLSNVDEIAQMNPSLRVIPYYKFQLYESAAVLDWDQSMRHLFGYEFDEDFQRDLKQVSDGLMLGLKISDVPSIPMELHFHGPGGLTLTQQVEYLTTVKTLVSKVYESWRKAEVSEQSYPSFILASIDLLLHRFDITAEIVRLIEDIVAFCPVNRLEPPTKTTSSDGSPLQWRTPFASLLFTACGYLNMAEEDDRAVKELSFTLPDMSEAMYQALCSVVVHSSKLEKLTISNHAYGAATDTKWRWIVYALFSNASTTSVSIVNAETTALLPIREPVDVASIVNAQYPHTQLLDGSSPVHDVDHGVVRLAKDTAVQFSSDPRDRITLDEESVVKIIRDDSSASVLDVLVPGYGPGKVSRDVAQNRAQRDITAVEEECENHRFNVKHLYFNDNESIRNAALVLPLIGDRLLSLRLFATRQSDEYLQLVFDHCPNLESLTINELSLVTVQPIINKLTAPHCRLKALQLQEWGVENEGSLVELLELLADPSSIPARRLQQLVLNDHGSEGGSFKAETATMLAKVVRYNRRLNYIEAFFKPTYYKMYKQALKQSSYRAESHIEEGEKDPTVSVPLRLSSKCAFLSAFPHYCGNSNTTVSRDLDSQATSLIFEFAAMPVRRTVVIRKVTYDF